MKKPLNPPNWDELRQIPLGLEIDEVEPGNTLEEARLRSEAARNRFEGGKERPEWFARYNELRAAGWSWRVACYIAWASCPKKERLPHSQEELATKILGLTSDRQIWTWRQKNPSIDETVAILQAAPLFEHRADIFRALIESATNPNYKSHQDRKIALEMLGDYIPRLRVDDARRSADDLAELSEEELARLAGMKPLKAGTSDQNPLPNPLPQAGEGENENTQAEDGGDG